jgi:hypothetical protein
LEWHPRKTCKKQWKIDYHLFERLSHQFFRITHIKLGNDPNQLSRNLLKHGAKSLQPCCIHFMPIRLSHLFQKNH